MLPRFTSTMSCISSRKPHTATARAPSCHPATAAVAYRWYAIFAEPPAAVPWRVHRRRSPKCNAACLVVVAAEATHVDLDLLLGALLLLRRLLTAAATAAATAATAAACEEAHARW